MKFKVLASVIILGAIFVALVLSGALDTSSSGGRSTHNDGIKLNP